MSELWRRLHEQHPDLVIEPMIRHHIAAGVYVREMHLPEAGSVAVTHRHAYDHLSILGEGAVVVTVDGRHTEYRAPAVILIRRGQEHSIRALTPRVAWYCIHAIPPELQDRPDEVLADEMDRVMIER